MAKENKIYRIWFGMREKRVLAGGVLAVPCGEITHFELIEEINGTLKNALKEFNRFYYEDKILVNVTDRKIEAQTEANNFNLWME